MATEKRIAKNTMFLLVGQVGQALGILVLWLIVARLLDPDALGPYPLAVALRNVHGLARQTNDRDVLRNTTP